MIQDASTFPLSLEELYTRYYQRIYQRVYALVHHREQAEDLTQETFLKAWKAYPTLKHTDKLYGWLYRIATNTAYDALRRERVVQMQSLDETLIASLVAANQSSQEPTFLHRLPLSQARAFLLHTQGYSYQEIAGQMNISLAAVRSCIYRARSFFRKDGGQAQRQVSA